MLTTRFQVRGFTLDDPERDKMLHQITVLERRLGAEPEPKLEVTLLYHPEQRRVQADFRLLLNPLGSHLISHQSAQTPEQVVRLAVKDLERQLERRHASQRQEPSYGVPSRREPRSLRPNPPPSRKHKQSQPSG